MTVKKLNPEEELHLPPGFRFFPTDEELVVHYLCRKVRYQCLPVPYIAEVDLYKYDPWQLPDKALFGEKEWYFFTPRDRKYPNGSRPNRSAGTGYWKATGADKPVRPTGSSRQVGIKKALVFYAGKAPKGIKTNWIMHEYRLADTNRPANKKGSLRLDDWVLCRLYNKKNSCEKPPQRKQEASLSETMDSLEAIDDSELESFTTPESDVESDRFTEVGDLYKQAIHQPQALDEVRTNAASSFWPGERLEEEKEWFMDLGSLDDLQNPDAVFGEMDLPDLVHQEYCFASLYSPLPKPYDDLLLF